MIDLIPLSSWQALIAIVDHGGYAQAAEALNKSQSSISYAIQKLESELGHAVFRIEGRRAVLTPIGNELLERARLLIDYAARLEAAGRRLGAGHATQIRLAIDGLFPAWLLLKVLDEFSTTNSSPRVDIMETVLNGAEEALLRRSVDMAIAPRIPQGFAGDPLMPVRLVAVAAASHPLHQLPGPIQLADLRTHRQLVIRDSGSQRENFGWLESEQRWTFTHLSSSVQAAISGLGFAWYPELGIRDELNDGRLKPLPLIEGRYRHAWLYRIFSRPEFPGAGCQALADCFSRAVENELRGSRSARYDN